MKTLVQHIIFSIFFFKIAFVEAQEIQVSNNFHHLLLGNRVEIFEDKSKSMNLEEVKKQQFSSYPKQSINLGFTNSYYWLRFRLKNIDSTKTHVFLEISNPHINKIQLFANEEDKLTKSILTGDHFAFQQRAYRHPHFVFPIELQAHQSIEYYLWIDKHGEQLQIPIALWAAQDFSAYNDKLRFFVGTMLGISGLFVLISFILFLYFREKLMLYYWLYTSGVWVFLVAHSGFGFHYIWQNSIWWASSARPLSSIAFYFFAILFTRKFFNIQKQNRYLDIHTKVLLALLSFVFVAFFSQNPALGLFKNHWYNPVFYEGNDLLFIMKTTSFVVLISIWSIIGIGIYFYLKTKKTESLWFTLGFSTLVISGTLVVFIFVGYIPDNYFTQNIPLVLHPLEIIILSFLLANRLKNIYLQNAQISAELAEQRQKNAIQLLEGQMIERHRLSQELHDGISLTLANIRLRLSMLADKLHSNEINALVENLGEVGQDVRQFSHALSPVMLEKNGLIEAIEELINSTQSNQARLKLVFLHDEIDEKNLNILLKQTIYQIILELINNTVRHAKASEIQVWLHQNKNHLILEVSDNGIGYELHHKQKGIGLQNIKARTQSLYGKFQIKRQGIGMKHLVEIPLQTKLFS